jgi:hypothetical protein
MSDHNLIKPKDNLWIAYVISYHNDEVKYIGIVPQGTNMEDVKWPEWSQMLGDDGRDRYRFRIDPLDVFLDDWIKAKLRNLKFAICINC